MITAESINGQCLHRAEAVRYLGLYRSTTGPDLIHVGACGDCDEWVVLRRVGEGESRPCQNGGNEP